MFGFLAKRAATSRIDRDEIVIKSVANSKFEVLNGTYGHKNVNTLKSLPIELFYKSALLEGCLK